MKWLKIIGCGLVTAIFGGASYFQTDYNFSEYFGMFNNPKNFTAYVPAILLLMALLSAWQTINGLFAKPASAKDVEDIKVETENVAKSVTEARTITQGEAAKSRLHTSSEAERIIEVLTNKFDNMGAEEKLNFEKAAEHILTSMDERDKSAALALEIGNIGEAVRLRRNRLTQENAYLDDMNKAHAAQWRETGALAFPFDTKEATRAYENAVRFDGTDVWDFIFLSRLYIRGGNLNASKNVLDRAFTLKNSNRDQSVVLNKYGDVAAAQGDLSAARKAYEDGLAIANTLAKADSSNTELQRDLIVSYVKLSETIPEGRLTYLIQALQVATDLNNRGRLAPRDAWMIEDLTARLEAAKQQK